MEILLALFFLFFILWKRRKKEEEAGEEEQDLEKEKLKAQLEAMRAQINKDNNSDGTDI